MSLLWILFLLFKICFGINPTFVEKSGDRFVKILLPTYNISYPAEIRDYSVFMAPISNCPLKQTTELCKSAKEALIFQDPSHWNNTSITNPCSKYFCERMKGYNDSNLHYSAHRYCLQCVDTIKENLTLSKNCSLMDQVNCNVCSPDSTCIYYEKTLPLCYHYKENTFYARDDSTHIHLLKFWLIGSPVILFFINLVLIGLYLFFIIIPTLKSIIKFCRRKSEKMKEKIAFVFQLQNHTKIVLTLACVSLAFGSFLDILLYIFDGSQNFQFTSLFGYLTTFLIYLGVNALIFYWLHILGLMEAYERMGKESSKIIIGYIISLIISIIFAVFAVMAYLLFRVVDKSNRVIFIYFLSSILLLIALLCCIFIIVFSIMSIRMIIILSKSEDNILEVALKLKVRMTSF